MCIYMLKRRRGALISIECPSIDFPALALQNTRIMPQRMNLVKGPMISGEDGMNGEQ